MRDWLSYRLSDLLLFSPRTYYRMFELYHQEVWPVQLLALAGAVLIIAFLWRANERSGVVIAALLATMWLWVGISFHLMRYATINWAARYFAVLFVTQAALVVWYGIVRRRMTFRPTKSGGRWLAPAVFIAAIVLPPLSGLATDRTWTQVELFGLTPDATAVATLALVLVGPDPAPRMLALVPLAWCAIGAATMWAMASGEAWVSIAAVLAGVLVMCAHGGCARSVQTARKG